MERHIIPLREDRVFEAKGNPMNTQDTDAVELKPCPFCGGEASIVEAEECGPQAQVVCCKGCMCSSKVIFALKDDVTEELIEAWNTRATNTPTDKSKYYDWIYHQDDPENAVERGDEYLIVDELESGNTLEVHTSIEGPSGFLAINNIRKTKFFLTESEAEEFAKTGEPDE